MGILTPSPDGTITIQGSDGNPVRIPQAALTSAPSVLPQLTGGAGTITVPGPGGRPVQVPQAMVAQAQLGMLKPSADGTITIQGSDGVPVKIPQAALASAPS